tara:strand:- start:603 stop:1544 length:942 start_codon:yes stop_codon:yes gene_type:complete
MIFKNILITGGAGYIGSKLTTRLVQMGHQVTVIDKLMFDKNSLSHLFIHKNFKFIYDDLNKIIIKKNFLRKFDFIIPLAALVGAPLCDKNKHLAINTNVKSLIKILENLEINQKVIYPTTNSGYGVGEKNKFCTEETPLNPISLYGKTKSDAEKLVMSHKNSISFRLATVFGYSYRMRTDLLVNFMTREAVFNKKLVLFEPNFRRNFIHINDIVEAFIFSINNFRKLKGNVYNLGLSSANITKLELAERIKKIVKELQIFIDRKGFDPDKRDYVVSNKKIEKSGFKAKTTLEKGIKELINVYKYSNTNFKNNY